MKILQEKMECSAKLVLISFAIACFLSGIDGQDTCVKKGPCTCAFSNGTGIDLTPINKGDEFFSAQIFTNKTEGLELSTYFYHPCYDVMPKPPINVSGNNNTCNQNLTMCRHQYTLKLNSTNGTYTSDAGFYNYLGKANDSTFSINGDSIIYDNPPSKTIVLLVCAVSEDKLFVSSTADPNAIVLSLYSSSACLKALDLPEEGGRSLGSTLLIIFFSLTIFYLVLGICTKKFLMGATGVEVIPNLAFWSDLPNLVKDGWSFAVAGFKLPARGSGPALSPDPNSYDSI